MKKTTFRMARWHRSRPLGAARKVMRLGLLLALLAGLTAVVLARRSLPLVDGTLLVGDLERTYHVYAPRQMQGRVPLVFVFHGGGGTGEQMARHTGFAELAEQEGFVAVFPDAYSHNWNDGRNNEQAASYRQGVDDLAFVRALLDRLLSEYPVDPDRVYATGISNGGFMSNYVGANLSERLAAVAPVVGGIGVPFDRRFAPSEPVSVLIIQGTDDPLVPYNGGGVGFAGGRGEVIPTPEAVELWRQADGCQETPVETAMPDTDPEDGCRATRSRWSRGRRGSEVELIRIEGGGHGWPGASQYLPAGVIGPVCQDFEANQVIWEFFRSHPKR